MSILEEQRLAFKGLLGVLNSYDAGASFDVPLAGYGRPPSLISPSLALGRFIEVGLLAVSLPGRLAACFRHLCLLTPVIQQKTGPLQADATSG